LRKRRAISSGASSFWTRSGRAMSTAMPVTDDDRAVVTAALARLGLATAVEIGDIQSLSGGVSCDVWRAVVPDGRAVVVKRALPALRVADEWLAPVERSATEVAWIRLVAKINPDWVPHVLREDSAHSLFVMDYLPPERHPVWKTELAAGRISLEFAS